MLENKLENREVMARNIRSYMKKSGKTRQDVCKALGFPYSTFSEWLTAKKYPRIDKIELMAEYFGCEKSDLIEDKQRPATPGEGDELSENKKALMQLIHDCPEDKAARLLQIMQLFLYSEKQEN